MNELFYAVALTLIPKVGPVTARNLLSYTGSAEGVFRSSRRALNKIPGIGPQISNYILSSDALNLAEAELRHMERHSIQAVFCLDPDYPARLKHYPDSPLVLFFKGNADLNPANSVSIIGTRKPSPQGLAFCEELIFGLNAYAPTIISGMAYGIDICAHRAALRMGFPTIGILAHGLEHLYPAAHKATADRMLEGGALLTEYPFSTMPEKEHFPLRNRIVAALCDALVVVETGVEGGSMITVQFANDYNKDVFAAPGRARDPHAAGCNLLIKTHRAGLLESAQDLIDALNWEQPHQKKVIQQQLFVELSAEEKKLVDLLRQKEEAGMDLLSVQTAMAPSQLAAMLLDLELKGVVKSLPGKRFALISA
ncbi:MAG: DNA-protecting protein DprA [Haliscomenobacter sp.]|nr:DNA-protecting protein DprA [Haliscomenobacter sp.]